MGDVIECAKRMRQVTKVQAVRKEVGLLSSAEDDLAAPVTMVFRSSTCTDPNTIVTDKY